MSDPLTPEDFAKLNTAAVEESLQPGYSIMPDNMVDYLLKKDMPIPPYTAVSPKSYDKIKAKNASHRKEEK